MSDTPKMTELADDKDELDGCGPDFAAEGISDAEVLGIVFGSHPDRWAEYRAWFDAVRRQG